MTSIDHGTARKTRFNPPAEVIRETLGETKESENTNNTEDNG